MSISRRDALTATLFGGAMIGLRSLATGLPVKMILNPKKALADMQTQGVLTKPQFVIMQTSYLGDPLACNAPGTYDDGGTHSTPQTNYGDLAHPSDVTSQQTGINPVTVTFGSRSYMAAGPWSTLPASTCVCHIQTSNIVHPKEPDVLKLMGATYGAEMFPSILSQQLAKTLVSSTGKNVLQPQPISVGAVSPIESLTFGGQALPTIPPLSLRSMLSPLTAQMYSGTNRLQAMRDDTLNKLYPYYKDSSSMSPAQKSFIDEMVLSQQQVRELDPNALQSLLQVKDNSVDGQIAAAIALIKMWITPVITMHIPFGGDNHADAGLANEASQTVTGMQGIVDLLAALQTNNLTDQVTFISLNTFGRTMKSSTSSDGRSHNSGHQVSLMIGKGFRGGVIGGVGPSSSDTSSNQVPNDYGCVAFDSTSGLPSASGDVTPNGSLMSWAKTVMVGLGASDSDADKTLFNTQGSFTSPPTIRAALA